jgi:iron complex outermembrane recepter protein
MSPTTRIRIIAGVAMIALTPGLAYAQTADAPKEPQTQKVDEQASADSSGPAADDKEIVVTGTLIRGKPPVGSNVIGVGEEKIESTASATSNDLLATIPQVTNYFNRVPVSDLAIATNQIQISRPNLRNISPNNGASSATLILVDGHRIATAGIKQASVDPDVIPAGAIERVEVVTEGGSSTYGADAVAGVINFITKHRVDGIDFNAHYGFADHYWQADASITAGKDWGSGSAYISYTFTKNDALFGRDRDFIRGLNYTSQPYAPLGRTCVHPNLAVNTVIPAVGFTLASTNFALPGGGPGSFNPCDTTDNSSIVPEAKRHGVIAGLFQNLDDKTTLDARAYWSRRKTLSTSELGGVVTIGPNNPFNAGNLPPGLVLGPVGCVPIAPGVCLPLVNQAAVSFSFAPALGIESQHSGTDIQEWGANVELKHELTDNWQVRQLFNYSHTNSSFFLTGVNSTRLNAAGSSSNPATAINPYNISATNPALIADLIDNEIAGEAKDDLLNLRTILEGKLLTLPGGDVRLAVGYEYMHDDFYQRYQSDIRIGTLDNFPFAPYRRQVHSLFGELQIPIFGPGNATGGLDSFVISASGRYDHYSDFGGTFNPKLGATYHPVRWLGIRGNWGTSFTAPTPLDQLGSLQNQISSFPFVAFQKPGEQPAGGSYTVAVQGSLPGLKPQTANTWSVGFDADPPFVRGFHATLSYYHVKFQDILATPTPNNGIFINFPNNVVTNPAGLSPAQLRDFATLAPNGSSVVEPLIASGTPVYEAVDFRVGNFGILEVSGLDFGINYRHKTGFGGFDLSVNGNYQLKRESQASPTSAVVDVLATENPKLLLQTIAGIDIGHFRAEATWNHTSGYAILPTNSVPVQTHVDAFDTVDLFFRYDLHAESSLLKDLSLTLNVKNVFDADPPVLLRNNPNENGFANGFTFGRMFIFGVSKKF